MNELPHPGPSAEQTAQWLRQRDFPALRASIANADLPDGFRIALLDDLYRHQQNDARPGESKVKQLINAMETPRLYGLFNVPYFPTLGLDGLHYEALPLPEYPGLDFASPVVPVRVLAATPGFRDRTVVALFPENHLDGIQTANDRIFYFINQFVVRHLRRTRPIIKAFTEPGLFDRVVAMDEQAVAEASVHWVWLHERFHREGPAPLPEYLDIKSCRPLAGLEECRVDMEAICRIHDTSAIPRDKVEAICLFILSERLLRYSVEGIPNPNYDAIGSQVLVNFLKKHGSLWVRGGRLGLAADYIDGLRAFVTRVREIESGVESRTREEVKQDLLAFVNTHMNIPYASRSYQHDEFFLTIQRELRHS
jgi:hypothetical protein